MNSTSNIPELTMRTIDVYRVLVLGPPPVEVRYGHGEGVSQNQDDRAVMANATARAPVILRTSGFNLVI